MKEATINIDEIVNEIDRIANELEKQLNSKAIHLIFHEIAVFIYVAEVNYARRKDKINFIVKN